MEQKINTIREACIKANPEIERETELICSRVWEAWEIGTMTQDDFEFVPRPIRLADVLDAILGKDNEHGGGIRGHAVSSDGRFMEVYGDAGETGAKWFEAQWNLSKDNLSDQSEETIEFLYNLLK